MLTLNDGRSELWQWDTGRKLTVDAECSQVHFSNKVFGRSVDMDVVDGSASIPDILLQIDNDLTAWAFVGTAENGYTKISKTFKVNRRNKPADYVFTPTEQETLAGLVARLDAIEESQDPDAIRNAVEDYLEQNPVEIPVESVNGKTGKVNLTATDVGAISQDDLQQATNEALAQAKASGEFDGADGVDGKDGYTPVKGVDYFDGKPGQDGTSPVVSVSAIEGGHRITITDANGTKTVDVLDGQNGNDGNGIKSAVLNADYTLTLTFDDGTSYTTPSIRGATGETGSSGKDGNDGKDGVSVTHSWNGTTLTVTSASGTSSANLKGDKGDKGDPGETGPAGSDATVVVDSSLSSTSTNPVQNKVVTAKFNSLARRMSEVGWNGATDKVAYYEIGRMPAYNSGDNRGSVLLTGRLGHWIASSIANFSILLSNRSGCQASVFAQGNVTGALNCCDIEVYRQIDDTDIIYIKTKGYWVFDLEYVANQVTMQYKNVQVTPTGTKVWTLSEEKRVSTDFQGAMTANEFKGKFTATEDPTTAMGVATKQYVDNQISAKVAEQEDLVSAVLNALPTWTGGSY